MARTLDLHDASEHESATYKIRVKSDEDRGEVTIRIDRRSGSGRPLYDTLVLSWDEAEWLRCVLADELG